MQFKQKIENFNKENFGPAADVKQIESWAREPTVRHIAYIFQ